MNSTLPANSLELHKHSNDETTSIRDILNRYNRSYENVSTEIEKRNRSVSSHSTPISFQTSTRSVSVHQFGLNHLSTLDNSLKGVKCDQYEPVRLRINADDEFVIFMTIF